MMPVADVDRYRPLSATVEKPATVAGSGGSGGSAIFKTGREERREIDPLREAYEERAAILEFDAGMSRQDAEHLARRLTGYEGA